MTDNLKNKLAEAAFEGLKTTGQPTADATEGGKYDANSCGGNEMCRGIDC